MWDMRPFAPANRCTKVFTGHQHNFEQNLLKCDWSPDGSRVRCPGRSSRVLQHTCTSNDTDATLKVGLVYSIRSVSEYTSSGFAWLPCKSDACLDLPCISHLGVPGLLYTSHWQTRTMLCRLCRLCVCSSPALSSNELSSLPVEGQRKGVSAFHGHPGGARAGVRGQRGPDGVHLGRGLARAAVPAARPQRLGQRDRLPPQRAHHRVRRQRQAALPGRAGALTPCRDPALPAARAWRLRQQNCFGPCCRVRSQRQATLPGRAGALKPWKTLLCQLRARSGYANETAWTPVRPSPRPPEATSRSTWASWCSETLGEPCSASCARLAASPGRHTPASSSSCRRLRQGVVPGRACAVKVWDLLRLWLLPEH